MVGMIEPISVNEKSSSEKDYMKEYIEDKMAADMHLTKNELEQTSRELKNQAKKVNNLINVFLKQITKLTVCLGEAISV